MKDQLQHGLTATITLILSLALSQVSVAQTVKTRMITDTDVPETGFQTEQMAVIASAAAASD